MRYSVTLPASKLTINAPDGGAVTSGGEEAGERLTARIIPTSPMDAIQDAIESAGARRTGDLAEKISGTNNRKSKEYRTVARYLQRVANGEIKKPSQKKWDEYARKYKENSGQQSGLLESMRRLASGEQLPGKLPKGNLTIRLNAKVNRSSGKKRRPDIRKGWVTSDPIPSSKNVLIAKAMADPIGAWNKWFNDIVESEIFEVYDLELIYETEEAS